MKTNHDSKPSWYEALLRPPVEGQKWTAAKSERLLQEISMRRRKKEPFGKRSLKLGWFVPIIAILAAAMVFISTDGFNRTFFVGENNRNAGTVDGAKWEMLPGGEMIAGTPAGAMWMIHKQLKELMGHKVQIIATHQQLGMSIVELPEMTINDTNAQEIDKRLLSSVDAVTKTRIASDMAIPLGGKWRFELFIDGLSSGSKEWTVPDGGWELSPSFVSGSYSMTGTQGKLGFIDPGFIAGKGNKYMWHFWGTKEELTGGLQIYAVRESTNELLTVFESRVSPGEHNGADAVLPSGMTLPHAGKWKLIVMINKQWFGNVVVQVEKGE
ncbi:DUF4871 domain-containing protein [Bacillus sp. FJAT-26390]|uniref:DUF4871 domain-containing protein n=1 Tax=Bacillus sp. FJAT-26390 TaxID=1743142 RepID=UPI000807FD9C|nr:DUF4871 domain-containing protein [Bacillus sp. FJAT-26390]OBZ09265.1 hypothetical protein A7975_24455 [Bacillus sp. FJAT-26390]